MREILLMDEGWRFHEGDVKETAVHGYMYVYTHTKTERGQGPASMDFDDSAWESVTLPHDYAVLHKPTPAAAPQHGSLIRNQAWYRRNFRLEPSDSDKRIRLWMEGVCSRCSVWINGCYMGFFDSAYTEIDLDITDIARYGDDHNTVAVYVDNREYEGWWYEGAGIYRHVHLVKTERVSIERDGVWVHPEKEDGSRWCVPVETTVVNLLDERFACILRQRIRDAKGAVVAETESEISLKSREQKPWEQLMETENPALWSVDHPTLYTLETALLTAEKDGGESVLDHEETSFGFRTIRFDPEQGFFLNEVPTKIKGMCLHEDHGGFGAAVPDRIKEYRVRCLKEMGCNGYRFSHNPHSRETLDACDRLGMLVMDENRWFESSENGLRRLKAMVRRDRNHPSVVLWSVGNEEFLQAGKRGKKIMATMRAAVRSLDTQRPVLMAMHTGLLEEGAADTADMIGMNYNIDLVSRVHERYPDKAIIFSEANSCNDEDVLGDRESGVKTWKIVHETPYVCGLFAWTGMDYRGEHDYPGLFALCGAMDQNGYPKESYSLYRSWWRDEHMAAIEPNRNPLLDDRQIRLVGNGEHVILYQDGRKLYEADTDAYEPREVLLSDKTGIFTLENLSEGKVTAVAACVLKGEPDHGELRLETPETLAGCRDVAVLTLRILDEKGYLLPDAALSYKVTDIRGGRLLLTGNGDVQDDADRRLPTGKTWRGQAQILVEPLEENVEIQVSVEGLKEAVTKEIRCKMGAPVAKVPTAERRYLTDWKMADWTEEKPELVPDVLDGLKGYRHVEVGHGTQMHDLYKDSGFLVYHTTAALPGWDEQKGELYLYFELLEGKTDILIQLQDQEGHTLETVKAVKTYQEPGELEVKIPRREDIKKADIRVCLEVFMPFCGITKPVRWLMK